MSTPQEEIRNLLGRYTEAMDAGDWQALGALFEDGRLVGPDGTPVADGLAEVVRVWTGMVRLYDGSPRTRHLTANPVIDVDGDEATCRAAYLVHQQVPGGPLVPIAAGRYRDRFACTSGRWHFVERQFFLDQVGDLSGHMA